MLRFNAPTFVAIALVPIISACNNGGGGDTQSFSGFSNVAANSTTRLEGRGRTADFQVNSGTSQVTVSNVSGNQSATVEIRTDANGDAVGGSFASGNSTASFGDGDTVEEGPSFIDYTSGDENTRARAGRPDTNNFEHQSFGVWITGFETGTGTIGTTSVGTRTAAANVPTATPATFNGRSAGLARRNDGIAYATDSQVEISTGDFRTLSITSSNTNGVNLDTNVASSTPELDFTGTATVNGAEFSGTITGTAVNGSINGDFFGPNAEEVGGLFESESGSTTYLGAFGAVRP